MAEYDKHTTPIQRFVLNQLYGTYYLKISSILAHEIGLREAVLISALFSKFVYVHIASKNEDFYDAILKKDRDSNPHLASAIDSPGQWFYCTYADLHNKTSLSERQIRDAMKKLVQLNIIQSRPIGMPMKICYQFNWDRLATFCYRPTEREENQRQEELRSISHATVTHDGNAIVTHDGNNGVTNGNTPQSLTGQDFTADEKTGIRNIVILESKGLDNINSLVNTNVLTKEKQTACAVSGRGSSETPCSASAGIGWRSKSKGKTSSPEPHDSPDSLRKTESSFPENISSLAPDNIPVLTPIIDDSEHFQNSDVSDIIPEEKMDSSPIKPVLSTVSGDDNIPPVQVKNRDNFKIRNSYNGAESKEIIDHWNSTGLKFLDSKYKSSVTNYLTDIMNGTFFDDKPWLKSPSKAFGKHEIMAAIDNRAMAAIDVNYSPIDPVRKKAMRDLPMWLWLYNPSTRKSQFLNNLKPPKPSYRQPNLIEDEQPPFTAAIKAAYIKKILYGVEPVSSWSNHDENNFRRAGALLWEFVERNGKRIPFVYRHQYYRLAEALLDAILNDVNEDDRPSITTGWLCSDLTFNRRLPAYLGNIRMLL